MLAPPDFRFPRRTLVLALIALSMTACGGELVFGTVGIVGDSAPESTTLDLRASSSECQGDRGPTEIEHVSTEQTRDAVTLEVLVRLASQLPWEAMTLDCPGPKEWLAFSVELEEPLGDRAVRYLTEGGWVADVMVLSP